MTISSSPSPGDRSSVAALEQLRLVADNLPLFIVHCDADRRYLFVNRPYAARFGLAPEDLVGQRIEVVEILSSSGRLGLSAASHQPISDALGRSSRSLLRFLDVGLRPAPRLAAVDFAVRALNRREI